MKQIAIVTLLLVCASSVAQAPAPKGGYVPSDKVAIQIAKAVLEGMQSQLFVKNQEPFCAQIQGYVWTVEGHCNNDPHIRGGGGLEMRIDKNTGAILGYYFAK